MKITITPTRIAGLMFVLFSLASLSAEQPGTSSTIKPDAAKKTIASPQPATTSQDPGQRKFEANCSRCHTAPEQLSPRIAGTVVRHMRVRASLSAEDERDILRFLAP